MVATSSHLATLTALARNVSITHIPGAAHLAAPATATTTASTTSLVILAAIVALLMILLRAARTFGSLLAQFLEFIRQAANAMTSILCTMVISVLVIAALLVHH